MAYNGEDDPYGYEQDDQTRALTRLVAPTPAAQLVGPMQGISNPPNGGAVTTISPAAPVQAPVQAQPAVAASFNPDPNASLRPGGTNPQAQPGALSAAMSSMPQPRANVVGPSGLQPAAL